MQGHGSTCDCTFSVLLHIALFLYVFCILCVSDWRGIMLCLTPPDFTGVPHLVWGTQFFHCLPSTV